MPDTKSPWYPYTRVQSSYYDLSDSVDIPRKICDFLLDAPKGDYIPPDDNRYPRCRLWKYLYYDGEHPLKYPLPTISEKMSVLFNPESPEEPPTEKGYRLIPQIYVKQAQNTAQTRIMVYMGRTVPSSDEMKISLSVVFYLWTHYRYELNTKSDDYSRLFAIEQAIIESFHGVNMAGIGTFYFSRSKHPDCGSRAVFDGNTNIGRELTLALEIATVKTPDFEDFHNMPFFSSNGKIRMV
ncbi:MAG: hypothetical protein IJ489_08835 [Clostridia bacterium]|nr:hypothetical protein [Clostridia bacterium]